MSANRVNARVLAVSSNEMKGSKKQGLGKPKVQAGDTVEDTEDTEFYSVELEEDTFEDTKKWTKLTHVTRSRIFAWSRTRKSCPVSG